MLNSRPQWLVDLAQSLRDPQSLLDYLGLSEQDFSLTSRKDFPFLVTKHFADLIDKSNLNDPILKQILPYVDEEKEVEGFIEQPLQETSYAQKTNNILHKYQNRLLLLLKASCAINCRYCFRRNYPYNTLDTSKLDLQKSLDYIANNQQIEEVILSGGDPLMAKDPEFAWLLENLSQIEHLKTLRIHTRLLVVLPNRITQELIAIFAKFKKKIVIVFHINHAQEISESFIEKIQSLKSLQITLLNQSVLLKGINDQAIILKNLSDKLFAIGILPYYLHLLDKVKGSSHFYVEDKKAKLIYAELQSITSGYLVPKLAREEISAKNKTLIN